MSALERCLYKRDVSVLENICVCIIDICLYWRDACIDRDVCIRKMSSRETSVSKT